MISSLLLYLFLKKITQNFHAKTRQKFKKPFNFEEFVIQNKT